MEIFSHGFRWENPRISHGICTQVKLAVSAGALATSDDGAWVCLANKAWVGWLVGCRKRNFMMHQ